MGCLLTYCRVICEHDRNRKKTNWLVMWSAALPQLPTSNNTFPIFHQDCTSGVYVGAVATSADAIARKRIHSTRIWVISRSSYSDYPALCVGRCVRSVLELDWLDFIFQYANWVCVCVCVCVQVGRWLCVRNLSRGWRLQMKTRDGNRSVGVVFVTSNVRTLCGRPDLIRVYETLFLFASTNFGFLLSIRVI